MKSFVKLVLVVGSLFLGSISVSLAQQKVDMMALQGSYVGEEKNGLANGKGKAVGKDTYIGEFKKGFPHGKGTYIWGEDRNVERFEGTFKNGKKEGEGKLTMRSGVIKEGIWLNDEYAYRVYFKKGAGISRISLKRGTGNENMVMFSPTTVRETRNKIDADFVSGTFLNVVYPFKREMEICLKGTWIPFSIVIEKPGTWGVSVVF